MFVYRCGATSPALSIALVHTVSAKTEAWESPPSVSVLVCIYMCVCVVSLCVSEAKRTCSISPRRSGSKNLSVGCQFSRKSNQMKEGLLATLTHRRRDSATELQ